MGWLGVPAWAWYLLFAVALVIDLALVAWIRSVWQGRTPAKPPPTPEKPAHTIPPATFSGHATSHTFSEGREVLWPRAGTELPTLCKVSTAASSSSGLPPKVSEAKPPTSAQCVAHEEGGGDAAHPAQGQARGGTPPPFANDTTELSILQPPTVASSDGASVHPPSPPRRPPSHPTTAQAAGRARVPLQLVPCPMSHTANPLEMSQDVTSCDDATITCSSASSVPSSTHTTPTKPAPPTPPNSRPGRSRATADQSLASGVSAASALQQSSLISTPVRGTASAAATPSRQGRDTPDHRYWLTPSKASAYLPRTKQPAELPSPPRPNPRGWNANDEVTDENPLSEFSRGRVEATRHASRMQKLYCREVLKAGVGGYPTGGTSDLHRIEAANGVIPIEETVVSEEPAQQLRMAAPPVRLPSRSVSGGSERTRSFTPSTTSTFQIGPAI